MRAMSNLWDLSHIQPETRVVLEGDTIPAMFWNAVDQRGPNVWMRQKELGIWRNWTWQQTGGAATSAPDGSGFFNLGTTNDAQNYFRLRVQLTTNTGGASVLAWPRLLSTFST